MLKSLHRRNKQGGNAIVEVALLSPWIFFLFVGILDVGFYTYMIICTENAARAAALVTAASVGVQDTALACRVALAELDRVPNVAGVTSCAANAGSVTSGLPVAVERKTLCASATVSPSSLACDAPGCADCATTPTAASSQVAVTSQSMPMIPIPGILSNQFTITRIVEARIITE